MNKISSFTFKTKAVLDQLKTVNIDKRIKEIHYDDDDGNVGVITFDDMEQEKYIQSLEDQLLLLADELNGGIL